MRGRKVSHLYTPMTYLLLLKTSDFNFTDQQEMRKVIEMKYKHLWVLCMVMGLLLGIESAALASPWHLESGNRTVARSEQIDGDLIFSGNRLQINGEVKGDLIVQATQVVINGRVDGSVIGVVGDKLTVRGTVERDIRVLARDIVISGTVNRSLTAIGLNLETASTSRIRNGILAYFAMLKLKGESGGPVELSSLSSTVVGGRIAGNLEVTGAPLRWSVPAEIQGVVIDRTGITQVPRVPQGVKTGGYRVATVAPTEQSLLSKVMVFSSMVWFLGSLLMSLIFFKIFPRTAWKITDPAAANIRHSLLAGLIGFFAIPLAIVILFFTMVGIPVAIFLILCYLLLLLFAWVPLNLWAGRFLFHSRMRPSLMIIIGSLALLLISFIPLLNLVAQIVLTWLGLGMILGHIKTQIKEEPQLNLRV